MQKSHNREAYLADELLAVREKITLLEASAAELRAEILATDKGRLTGERAYVVVDVQSRRELDASKVAALLTPTKMASCYSAKTITLVRVKPISKAQDSDSSRSKQG